VSGVVLWRIGGLAQKWEIVFPDSQQRSGGLPFENSNGKPASVQNFEQINLFMPFSFTKLSLAQRLL
jgi:hypothetical protein